MNLMPQTLGSIEETSQCMKSTAGPLLKQQQQLCVSSSNRIGTMSATRFLPFSELHATGLLGWRSLAREGVHRPQKLIRDPTGFPQSTQ